MSFFVVNQFQASRIKVLRTGFLKKFKKYLYAGLLSVFQGPGFLSKIIRIHKKKRKEPAHKKEASMSGHVFAVTTSIIQPQTVLLF